MQDQGDSSSSQSQEKEAVSSAKKMDEAAPSKRDLHRSVIDSLNEVPKFSEEWFRLKETEISLRLELEADLAEEDCIPKTSADEDMPRSAANVGIEQMPSTNDAPVAVGATMSNEGADLDDKVVSKKAACAKPEMMHDDLGADVNTSLLHGDSLSSNKKSARSSLETIEDDSSCPLSYYTKQDDLIMERKVAECKSVNFSALECDDESANTELPAESTGDIEHAIHEACPTQQQPDTHPSEASRVSNFGDESIFHPPPEADSEQEVARTTLGRNLPDHQSIETPLINAWAVDEESEKSVYMAEELVETQWWKQRRTKLLLGVLVVFVVLAITLGLVISQDVATSSSAVVIRSQSPSMSWTPTSRSSNAPSSSPTECIERMHTSMQTIDLDGEVEEEYQIVAVDGNNMVVVTTDVFGDYNMTVIKFFSPGADGLWERSTMIEAGVDPYSCSGCFASLSRKTAFVKIDSEEMGYQIFVYEQNTIGEWEEVQDPIEFGDDVVLGYVFSLDIDGDLACISGQYDQTYIFHRNGSKWIHFDTKNGTACTIFGDTVAIFEWRQTHLFRYNNIQNALSPIQGPILGQYWHDEMSALSNDYFAFYNDCDPVLNIYRLDPENETYVIHQQLMKSVFHVGDAKKLRMDNDVLVIAGYNETFIFVDQDGTWVESASIVDGGFQALSDRNAIFASDREVRAYSILDDCTQPMPTSSPSSEPSSAPSTIPTYSSAPSVSLSPSTSSSPTQCMKQVQLDLHANDPQGPEVAVDGSNLVVAVRDGDWNEIQFYSLVSSGEWEWSNSSFQFHATRNDVALSGNTTFLTFWDSPPLVFEQSALGKWEIMSDPFVFRDNATKELMLSVDSVDVDGDLACLANFEEGGSSLFRRNNSKWKEVHNFPATVFCVLSDADGTIAVTGDDNNDTQIQLYEYNEGQDAVLPIQDPIILEYLTFDVALSNDYLVYSQDDVVFVYKRNSVNQTYTFHQELAITGYMLWDLSLHKNTLVVATDNRTHIFVEQNGSWVERTVLYQEYHQVAVSGEYHQVAVSGQNLIASTYWEVHSYNLRNIEDCMVPTPLSTPSLNP